MKLLMSLCLMTSTVFAQKTFEGKSKYSVLLNKDYAEVRTKDSAAYAIICLTGSKKWFTGPCPSPVFTSAPASIALCI